MRTLVCVTGAILLLSLDACRDEDAEQEQRDQQRLETMRKEIVERIGEASCSEEGDCVALALGSKPCGGPREYLVYSSGTVDVEELEALADEYTRFDAELNKRYGYISDCMFVSPPKVDCVDGRCVATRP